jgi:uncharacterized damage-inducible protein DinB
MAGRGRNREEAFVTGSTPVPSVRIPTEFLRDHWQGHRRLTRRMIEAFPPDALFTYAVGGMRPFGAMAFELLSMADAGIQGIATGTWPSLAHHGAAPPPTTRETLLAEWDATTARIDQLWPTIPPERFEAVDKAFGQWEGVIYGLFLYWIDNEIHHRGQGYVYLRSLGLPPPAFWER